MFGQILFLFSWFALIGIMCFLCIWAVGVYEKKEEK